MTEIKTKFFEGIGNIGNALPVMGKVIGTTFVLKSVGKMKKPIKKVLTMYDAPTSLKTIKIKLKGGRI